MEFKNKVVLVTGASRGIGKEIAINFASKGASLIINASRESEALEDTFKKIKEYNVDVLKAVGDISKEEDVKNIFKIAKEMNGVDILINNAGITRDTLILRMKAEQWDDVINVNLKGTFLCSKYAMKGMLKKRDGRIINIASVSGLIGNIGQANYSASKGGVIALTKTIAKEVASRNITCNAIAPGLIDTDMSRKMNEEARNMLISKIPMGRMGKTKEVMELICFLASENSAYITGQTITIDGGLVM